MHSFRKLINKSVSFSFLLVLILSINSFSNGFELNCGSSGWTGNGQKSGTITNTTNVPWFSKGLRVNIHENVKTPSAFGQLSTPVKINDGNNLPGTTRWQLNHSGADNNNNFPGFGGSRSITVNPQLPWDDATTVWTPHNEQWLIKVGSFGTKKSFKDIKFITLDSLAILVKEPWFYDPSIYVPDTVMGDRGGPASGGVINTWYDQDGDTALWQIQMCETGAFQQNGEWGFWNPLVMGQKDATWGAGPTYAMALAMVTEYFHLDYQLMAASATNESMAGMEGCNFTGGWGDTSGAVPTSTSLYNDANTDLWMGTNHWEEPTYKDVIWGGYPKYFPEDANYVHSGKYSTTPGTGKCIGNSPQIANSELINSVYYWYIYELLYNSTEFYADFAFRNALDRELASKLFLAMWNGGRNSQDGFLGELNSNPDPILNNPDLPWSVFGNDYIMKIYRAITPMQEGSRNSVVIGGTRNVQDHEITIDDVESFFFGTGGNTSTGALGDAGILHHFSLTSAQRVAIWTKLVAGFDILKAQGPFSSNGNISLRYDWLALMRVVKGDVDLSFPTPTNSDFVTWVKSHSDFSVIDSLGGPKVENMYPHLVTTQDAHVEGDSLIATFKITEETYLDIDSLNTLEWTEDPNWANWKAGTFVSGDTLIANFRIAIHKDEVLDIAGNSKVTAWVRAFDRNYNATIDTFSIFWELSKNPTLDSAELTDINGDGLGDKIEVFIKKGEAADADALNSVSTVEYSWPDPGTPNSVNNASIDFTNSTSWEFDVTNLIGAGLGEITFDYPSKSGYKTDILDKVGPAILDGTPVYEVSSSGDTLALTFTENIDNLSGTGPFLAFKGSDSVTVTPQSIDGSNKNWSFIFNNGDLELFDSVKIVSNSTLTDTAGNSAENNNQWVHITKQGNNDPSWKIAYMKDLNGNGDGDELIIKISLGDGPSPLKASNLQKITYEWPTGNGTVELTTVSPLNDSTIVLSISPEISGFGDGVISLDFGSYSINNKTINDSVGTVIDSATYNEKNIGDTSDDTLWVELSEGLSSSLVDSIEYINLKTDAGAVTKVLVLKSVNVTSNTWAFILVPGTIGDNDSVNLVSGSGLEDNYENDPQSNNQYVYINKLGGKTPKLDKAYIKDINGDGFGDEISAFIIKGNASDAFTLDDCDSLKFRWPNSGTFKTVSSGLAGTSITITDSIDSAGAGTGTMYMFFNDNGVIEVSGSIIDSIGPAISTAYYKEQDGPCSLQVVFTEPIEPNLTDNTNYLNINGSSIMSSTVIPVGSDNLTWIFVLPENSISSGDSVNLISSSGLIDQAFPGDDANNKPHANNIKVEIEFESSIYTIKVNKSGYYDDNADGVMDSVILHLSKPINDSILNLMKFIIEWPDEAGANVAMQVNGGDFNISGQSISWKVNGYDLQKDLTVVDSTYGGVTIIQPVDDSTGTIDTSDQYLNIQDMMAPVLMTANYYIYKSATLKDELIVTFSEAITSPVLHSEPFKFNKNAYSIELSLQTDFSAWNDTLLLAFTKTGGDSPKYGDSLNINSFANIKGSIIQNNPLNKHVKLNVFSATSVEVVSYHDKINRDGENICDGWIDLIKVRTDTTVSSEMYDSLAKYIILNSNRNFEPLKGSDFSTLPNDEYGFQIIVTQSIGTAKNTSVSSIEDSLTLSGAVKTSSGFILNPEKTILDSMAPVITLASLNPVEITKKNMGDLLKDTLIIEFSEAVNYSIMDDNPLKFKKNDNTNITVDLTKEQDLSGRTVMYLIDFSSDKPKNGDSVQIDIDGSVADANPGNIQNMNNIYVSIQVKEVPFHWNSGVYPNPLLKSNEKQIEDKKTYLAKYLKISDNDISDETQAIFLDPLGPAPSEADVQVSIKVFDALGHIVLEDDFETNGEIWYYLWDGKNKNGRSVGSGIYLADIKILPENMDTEEKPLKLGIGQ